MNIFKNHEYLYITLHIKEMKKNSNTIRLTEQEFNALIEESVKRVIAEGKFGKVGDWLGAAALGGSLAAGAAGTMMQDPKQSDYYPEEDNIAMVHQDDPDYGDFEEVAPEDPEDAWHIDGVSESKIRSILRQEISKVL